MFIPLLPHSPFSEGGSISAPPSQELQPKCRSPIFNYFTCRVFTSASTTDLTGTTLELQALGTDDLEGLTLALLVNTGEGTFGDTLFEGLAEGATLQFDSWLANISYRGSFDLGSGIAWADRAGNDVVLWQIRPLPEPGTAGLLAAGLVGGMLLTLRRARTRRQGQSRPA